jgi:hypothetical protein
MDFNTSHIPRIIAPLLSGVNEEHIHRALLNDDSILARASPGGEARGSGMVRSAAIYMLLLKIWRPSPSFVVVVARRQIDDGEWQR